MRGRVHRHGRPPRRGRDPRRRGAAHRERARPRVDPLGARLRQDVQRASASAPLRDAPHLPVVVRITSDHGYALMFTVTTHDVGTYRGSFGSTAPRGHYAPTIPPAIPR